MDSRRWSRIVLGGAALVAGCGGTQKPQSALQVELVGAPKWVKTGCAAHFGENKKVICGAQAVSGMTNVALARSAAEGRARAQIARSLQVRVKAMLKDYQSATQGGPGNKLNSEQHIEDVSKQVTDLSLSGTRLEDTWSSNTGTFWALVVLDVDSFRESLQNMRQLDEAVRAVIVERAERSFAELDHETEGRPPVVAR